MDYFKDIEKIIDYIEENLENNLNIDELASKIYFSKFHFQRIFKAVVGETVMNYIRKRRLTNSAKMIKESKKNILEIAIEYEFSSQESYTRAFKSTFGISPGKYRKTDYNVKKYPMINLLKRKLKMLNSECSIDYEIVEIDDMELFGMKMESNVAIDDFDEMKKLWIEFLPFVDKYEDIIENKDLKYNIFTSGFRDGVYNYYATVRLKNEKNPDGSFEKIKIGKQKYAKFVHSAKINEDFKSQDIYDTINSIYEFWLPNSKYEIANIGIDMIIISDDKNLLSEDKPTIMTTYIPIK